MFTALRRLCNGFSPLFLPFRGSRFINGKKIHLHPYTHKGKEAKASFCLFWRFKFTRSSAGCCLRNAVRVPRGAPFG